MATIKAKAASLDFEIEKGATFDITLTWKDSAGVVVDLTGYTARMNFRSDIDSAIILDDLTTANSKIILGGVLGTIRIIITDAESTAYTFTSAVQDFELIAPSGDVRRLFEGSVTIVPEVTRV